MKLNRKFMLSILLFLISVSCFIYMPPSRSEINTTTITVSPQEQRTEESVTQSSGIAKILEWIGIGALVLAVWLWRKELDITQLGPLGGPGTVTQQEGGAPAKSPDESGPPRNLDLSAVAAEMADAETEQRLEYIMEMFQKTHAVNVSHVALELGVAAQTAKKYLFLLTKTGQLRADGFPKHTIYTPAHSLENRILDAARQYLSEKHGVLSERRYVRIGRMYEVDALLESGETTFLVEAKVLRKPDIVSHLDHWVMQVLNAAEGLPSQRVACVLAVACIEDVDATDVRKQIAGFTFDSGTVPVQVLVFSERELPE